MFKPFLSVISIIFSVTFSGNCIAGPLHEAAKAGDLETMQELLDAGERVDLELYSEALNKVNKDYTPLAAAASEGKADAVKLLIDNGATIGLLRRDSLVSMLDWGLHSGDTNTIKVLLDAGADPNESSYGEPVLSDAILKGHLEIADLLIKYGANSDKESLNSILYNIATDPFGAPDDKSELVPLAQYLLDKGASAKKSQALPYASGEGLYELAEFLIRKGARVNTPDSEGQLAIVMAINEYCYYDSDALKRDPKDITEKERALKVIDLLLKKGAKVNVNDDYDDPLFHKMAECGDIELAKRLLAKGAKINVTNEFGETVLDKALGENNPEMVVFLKSKGAKEGETDW